MKSVLKMLVLFGFVLMAFSPVGAQEKFMFEENPLVGKQAPDFTLNTTQGTALSLNQYRGNDPAVVFFWATWCPHCREELKYLSRIQETLAKANVKVVLVNLEENPKQVKAYLNKIQLPFNVFLDEKSSVAEQYSVIGLPTVFFIDRQGVVSAMEFGLPDDFAEMLGK